jgi:tRNA threonylcarbamoyladenosine biosynthesis protein TsaB
MAETEEKMERGQDQRLLPLIQSILQKTQHRFEDLDRLAVTRGPGSFTGLRIGLAAARGLGFATSKPVLGIDRFSIYAHQHHEKNKPLLVILQSKRQELFCRFYAADGIPAEPSLMTETEILTFLHDHPDAKIVGDQKMKTIPSLHLAKEKEVITAAHLAAMAPLDDPSYWPRPLYIRPPDVTMSTNPLFLRDQKHADHHSH